MSEAFDPYRKWLGIPPHQQPPNHYRLLGLELFESDADVISHAADRLMSHVRTFQNGKYGKASQQLLNEISAARGRLLDAEQKAAYDAHLRSRQQSQAKPASPTATRKRQPVAKPINEPVAQARPRAKAPGTRRAGAMGEPKPAAKTIGSGPLPNIAVTTNALPARRAAGHSSPVVLASAAGLGLLLIAGLVVGWMAFGRGVEPPQVARVQLAKNSDGKNEGEPTVDADRAAKDAPHKPQPSDSPPPTPQAVDSKPPPPGLALNSQPSEADPDESASTASVAPPLADPPKQQAASPAATDTTDAPPVDSDLGQPDSTEQAARPAVPSPQAQAAARALIEEVYGDDIQAAQTPEQMQKLAQSLVEDARGTANDPAAVYVLLDTARRLAVEAVETSEAIDIAALIAEHFDVDAVDAKAETLGLLEKTVRLPDQREAFAQTVVAVVEEAAAADRFDRAEDLVEMARSQLRRISDVDLRKKILASAADVAKRKSQWDVAQKIGRLTGHRSAPLFVNFGPNSRTALSGDYGSTIIVWDLATFQEIGRFTGHTRPPRSAHLSGDGTTVLSSSEDGTLRLWNAKTGEEIRRFVGHTNCVFDTDISPDRRRVVSAGFDNTIRLWDLASGKELHRFTTSARVWAVRFTPDGRGAVSAGDDGVVRLWRLPD